MISEFAPKVQKIRMMNLGWMLEFQGSIFFTVHDKVLLKFSKATSLNFCCFKINIIIVTIFHAPLHPLGVLAPSSLSLLPLPWAILHFNLVLIYFLLIRPNQINMFRVLSLPFTPQTIWLNRFFWKKSNNIADLIRFRKDKTCCCCSPPITLIRLCLNENEDFDRPVCCIINHIYT